MEAAPENRTEETAPPDEPAAASPVRRPPGLLRDTIEAVAIAFVMALTFKQFAIEAYKVPTGSMEPTIVGAEVGGDRILVNKIAYLLRDPRRWEVAVFRYPNNRTINYIKRVVGLPEETLFIIGGDIYTAAAGSEPETPQALHAAGRLAIARKPDELQNAIFERYPQIAPEHVSELNQETFLQYWSVPSPALPDRQDWTVRDGVAHADSPGRSLVSFRDRIRDNRKFTPPGAANRGSDAVSDVRLSLEVRPAQAGGMVILFFRDGHHELDIEFRLPVEGGGADGSVHLGGEVVADLGDLRLSKGSWTTVVATNVDNRLILTVDGEELCRHDYEHRPAEAYASYAGQAVRFGVRGAAADFRRMALQRDIHYQRTGLTRVDIPEGHYFMLGDNSPSSKDSREWSRLTIWAQDDPDHRLSGDAEAFIDPRDLTSRMPNPWWDEDRERRYFMDEFGTVHEISARWGIESKPSPLVPRELITGRAFAVFMPIKRIKLVQ